MLVVGYEHQRSISSARSLIFLCRAPIQRIRLAKTPWCAVQIRRKNEEISQVAVHTQTPSQVVELIRRKYQATQAVVVVLPVGLEDLRTLLCSLRQYGRTKTPFEFCLLVIFSWERCFADAIHY
jgi:hypothetical protein